MFIILLLCGLSQACGGPKLLDVSKSSTVLQLTSTQQQTIHPKLNLIRDLVEDYDFEKKQLEADYQVFRAGMTPALLRSIRTGIYRYADAAGTECIPRRGTKVSEAARDFYERNPEIG